MRRPLLSSDGYVRGRRLIWAIQRNEKMWLITRFIDRARLIFRQISITKMIINSIVDNMHKIFDTDLSPGTRWAPHFEQAKHLRWKTWCCGADEGGAPPPGNPPPVRITNSLAGIVWPHAEHAPVLPNILKLKK